MRDKSEIKSLGLDAEGTARGIVLRDVVTDLALMWPKYTRVALLGPGREWKVCDCTPGAGGTITVIGGVQSAGNATDFIDIGDTLNVTRIHRGEEFSSVELVVSNVTQTWNASAGRYDVVITFVGTVPTLALDGCDFLNTERVQPAPWQTWAIQSHTTGADADVVLDATTGQLSSVPDVALCDCDVFLCGDQVEIAGRGDGGKNNGTFTCRADKDDSNPLVYTVKLNGWLDTISSGSLGTITLLLPTPLRVVAVELAVLRAHSISLAAPNMVRVRRTDDQHAFWEIQTVADLGPPQWFDPVTP